MNTKKMKKMVLVIMMCLVAVLTGWGRNTMEVQAYTQDEIDAAKAWLSANGYPPTRSGAEQAYQDYLNGKFGPVGGTPETPTPTPTPVPAETEQENVVSEEQPAEETVTVEEPAAVEEPVAEEAVPVEAEQQIEQPTEQPTEEPMKEEVITEKQEAESPDTVENEEDEAADVKESATAEPEKEEKVSEVSEEVDDTETVQEADGEDGADKRNEEVQSHSYGGIIVLAVVLCGMIGGMICYYLKKHKTTK